MQDNQGAFIIPPLLEAYRRTRRGFIFDVSGLLRDGFTTAGALDTHCIDKESAIPVLNAGLQLFELTNERRYLDQAEHAAYYLASWQYHHRVAFPAGSLLHALGYDTFGGTLVSTQHHHIDPYGIAFVPGWLRAPRLSVFGRETASWEVQDEQGNVHTHEAEILRLKKDLSPEPGS
jgi:hypothetical protein